MSRFKWKPWKAFMRGKIIQMKPSLKELKAVIDNEVFSNPGRSRCEIKRGSGWLVVKSLNSLNFKSPTIITHIWQNFESVKTVDKCLCLYQLPQSCPGSPMCTTLCWHSPLWQSTGLSDSITPTLYDQPKEIPEKIVGILQSPVLASSHSIYKDKQSLGFLVY